MPFFPGLVYVQQNTRRTVEVPPPFPKNKLKKKVKKEIVAEALRKKPPVAANQSRGLEPEASQCISKHPVRAQQLPPYRIHYSYTAWKRNEANPPPKPVLCPRRLLGIYPENVCEICPIRKPARC